MSNILGIFSINLLRNGILKDGTCLLLSNFVMNQSLVDNEIFRDQVMINTATWHMLDGLREFTWIRLQMNSGHDMVIRHEQFGLQGFVEDNIKDTSCVFLIEGSPLGIPAWYINKVFSVNLLNLTSIYGFYSIHRCLMHSVTKPCGCLMPNCCHGTEILFGIQ